MNNQFQNNGADRTIGRIAALSLLCLALPFTGCSKVRPGMGGKAEAQATYKFWMDLQEPLPQNTLYNRMSEFDAAHASGQDLQAMSLLFHQLAESSRAKARQITTAPVVDVDVDAAAYGVKKAKMAIEFAKLFDRAAQLIESQNQLTSGETWVFEYLFALGRHANEGSDAWGNALKEELQGKAKTFGNLEVEGKSLASVTQRMADSAAKLQADEMQTRIVLAQRYGKEFPTSDALAKPATKPAAIPAEKLKQVRQELMRDMIGRKIRTEASGTWTFCQGEFQAFKVRGGTNYGDVIDFEVDTQVKGNFTGAEHNFQLLLTYQKTGNASKLVFVKPI